MALKDIEAIEHSVELKEFHRFHVWIWRLQYVFMALVILAAILAVAGLFGDGWLSRTQLVNNEAGVTYQRFARYTNQIVLEARLSGASTVAIPLDYFDRFRLDAVVPQPRQERVQGTRIVFEFDAAEKMVVRFHLLPLQSGASETTVLVSGTPFAIHQFVWP